MRALGEDGGGGWTFTALTNLYNTRTYTHITHTHTPIYSYFPYCTFPKNGEKPGQY